MHDFKDARKDGRRCLKRQPGHWIASKSLPSFTTAACSLTLLVSQHAPSYGEAVGESPESQPIIQLSREIPTANLVPVGTDIDLDSEKHWIPIEFEQAQMKSGIAFRLDPIVQVAQIVNAKQNAADLQPQEFLPAPGSSSDVPAESSVLGQSLPAPLPRPSNEQREDAERNIRPPAATMRDQLELELTDDLFPEASVLQPDTVPQADDSRHQVNLTPSASVGVRPWLDIRPRTLDNVAPALISKDELPEDESDLAEPSDAVNWIQLYRADLMLRDIWPGAAFCHRPLYFQDAQLERCGTIRGPLHHCPSVHSAIHFAWRTGILPASMAFRPPCRCVPSGCR